MSSQSTQKKLEIDHAMKNGTDNKKRMVQYLLGRLSPEEQVEVEEQYLNDPDFYQTLQVTERDLIDQYVHGEVADREQFERYFLALPRRRQEVEFARAL